MNSNKDKMSKNQKKLNHPISVVNLKTSSFNMGSTASGATTTVYGGCGPMSHAGGNGVGVNTKKRKRIEFESA